MHVLAYRAAITFPLSRDGVSEGVTWAHRPSTPAASAKRCRSVPRLTVPKMYASLATSGS